jgi:hypothetical protein
VAKLQLVGDPAVDALLDDNPMAVLIGMLLDHLSHMLMQRGDVGDCQSWSRQAAASGHRDAMFNLGLALMEHVHRLIAIDVTQSASRIGPYLSSPVERPTEVRVAATH